jgi:hypothetical protein
LTAPAPTDARAEARERFYRAALWHATDPQCSNALAEFEDAYEALSAFGRAAVHELRSRRAALAPNSTEGRSDRG